VGEVFNRVARERRPLSKLPREQRVGRLIGRKVRGDVENVQQSSVVQSPVVSREQG
jgi:hypothetical protein